MEWPTTKYRLTQRTFAPRFPGMDHELLEAGTEIVSSLKPGPHMEAMTPEGEAAKLRAGPQALDFTQHQPLASGDEDDIMAARIAKSVATAMMQFGAPGVQLETVALAQENVDLKARLDAMETRLASLAMSAAAPDMNAALAAASQANAAPLPPPPPTSPPPPPPPPAKRK